MKADGKIRAVLEDFFKHTPKPSREQLEVLGKQTNRKYTTLYRWFLTRRNHLKFWKRKTPQSIHRSRSRLVYKLQEESSSDADGHAAASTHGSQFPYNLVPDKPEESPEETERFSPDSPSSFNATPQLSEMMPCAFESQNIVGVNVQARDLVDPVCSGHPQGLHQEDNHVQISDSPVADLLGYLTSREISVLDQIFSEVPNPTREDIARLASRFIKEQDKQIQIANWFAKRRADSSHAINGNCYETGSELC